MKNFTSISDISNPNQLVEEALNFKSNPIRQNLWTGKKIGLIFLNPSLRTRLSAQIAAQNLGAEAIVLDLAKDAWGLEFEDGAVMNGDKAEHIKEAAGVLGRYFDVLGIRTFPQLIDREEDYSEKLLKTFMEHIDIPIVSLESATRHPLQSLADLVTIQEHWQEESKPKVVLTWAPHTKALPQAVPNSFVEWMIRADVELAITNPVGYDLAPEFTQHIETNHNQMDALEGADFVYVKNWSSYEHYGKVICEDADWTFGKRQLEVTNKARVMHCLPVRRGVVIHNEILDGPNAIHLDQAENRVFATQAVLNSLLEK